MAAAAILKNRKNGYISAADGPILTKFRKVMQIGPLERSDRQNFEILQIPDGGGRHPDNDRKPLV